MSAEGVQRTTSHDLENVGIVCSVKRSIFEDGGPGTVPGAGCNQ